MLWGLYEVKSGWLERQHGDTMTVGRITEVASERPAGKCSQGRDAGQREDARPGRDRVGLCEILTSYLEGCTTGNSGTVYFWIFPLDRFGLCRL